jgi:hypothetical protein
MKGGAGAALACLAVAQIDPLGFARGDDLQRAAMAFANPLYATLTDVHQPLLRSSRSTFSSYRFKPENSRSVHSVDGFRERNRSWTAPAVFGTQRGNDSIGQVEEGACLKQWANSFRDHDVGISGRDHADRARA